MSRAKSQIQQLYEKLLQKSEIPIIERADIISKGLYLTEERKKEIYIKQSLIPREKLKVLLHEYSHHIHLTHYFNHESRAECEIIANGSAFLVCREYELKVFKGVDLTRFSNDKDKIEQVSTAIQYVANHILSGIMGKDDDGYMCCLHDTPRSFDWCEKNCDRYSSCDTVAQAGDELDKD